MGMFWQNQTQSMELGIVADHCKAFTRFKGILCWDYSPCSLALSCELCIGFASPVNSENCLTSSTPKLLRSSNSDLYTQRKSHHCTKILQILDHCTTFAVEVSLFWWLLYFQMNFLEELSRSWLDTHPMAVTEDWALFKGMPGKTIFLTPDKIEIRSRACLPCIGYSTSLRYRLRVLLWPPVATVLRLYTHSSRFK